MSLYPFFRYFPWNTHFCHAQPPSIRDTSREGAIAAASPSPSRVCGDRTHPLALGEQQDVPKAIL